MAIIGQRILRCSNGHLFTSSETSRLLGSFHLGPARLMQCPVDGKWGLMGNVAASSLSEEQLAEAEKYRA